MTRRRPIVEQLVAFRRPGEEQGSVTVIRIFQPVFSRRYGWICEYEAPGFLERKGIGGGESPLFALLAAAGNLNYFLNRLVDVADAGSPKKRRRRRKSPKK